MRAAWALLAAAAWVSAAYTCYGLGTGGFRAAVQGFVSSDGENGGQGVVDKWALLVAGSNGWWNYRHQADVCHAYHLLKEHGFPDERIVVMRYDDIAENPSNPLPGVVVNRDTCVPNKTDPSGNWILEPGCNVEAGCGKDYFGAAVSPDNFLSVLKGDAEAVDKTCAKLNGDNATFGGCNGKVLNSTSADHIFVAYFDHGATHVVGFPALSTFGPVRFLTALDLMRTLYDMRIDGRYGSMILYIEACESGSMFNGILPDDISIWATTASDPYHSSYACYCSAYLNATRPLPCLGDLYSTQWMDDIQSHNMSNETWSQDLNVVEKETAVMSQVCAYGNQSLALEPVSEYLKYSSRNVSNTGRASVEEEDDVYGIVDTREAKMHYLERARQTCHGTTCVPYQEEEYLAEKEHRLHVDDTIKRLLVDLKLEGDIPKSNLPRLCYQKPSVYSSDYFACLKGNINSYEAFCDPMTEYTMRYISIFSQMCSIGLSQDQFAQSAKRVCGQPNQTKPIPF
mmetsp:Transcript_3034/g.7427  ORF Transcript_3034/g.7427 Transcript_3034/m.7427 type:complete len:512 (-) Transcript_3034:29-1564(-)